MERPSRLTCVLGTVSLALAMLTLDKYATPREDLYGGTRTIELLSAVTVAAAVLAILTYRPLYAVLIRLVYAVSRWVAQPRRLDAGRFHFFFDGFRSERDR